MTDKLLQLLYSVEDCLQQNKDITPEELLLLKVVQEFLPK